MPAATGPVPGQLRIVVIRALKLRVDAAGNSPDAAIKIRVLRNIKSAEPPPQWESAPVPATCDPEFDQECVLDVIDAASSQLEVTIWNAKDNNPQSGFWGECILNLSKLIPYAGNIIEQDFDVKQGKQFKTDIPACGKLMLQIMFQTQEQLEASQMEETQETQNSSILSAGTSGNTPQQGPSPFAMSITVIEARDLPNNAAGDPPETFACVSVIDDPSEIEDRHFHLIDHDLSNGKEKSPELMKIQPLHWSKPGPHSNNPVWSDGCTLTESHPAARKLEQLHKEGTLATSQLRTPMEGKPLVFVVSLHNRDAYNAGSDSFVGRVVLPEIEAGKPVDQWFMLQTQDGTQIEGPTGRPSGLHLQIVYAQASTTPSLGPPNTVPHTLMAAPARPPPHSPPSASPRPPPSPRPQAPSVTSDDGGTRFAFHVEIVEARNLSTSEGKAAEAPFACVSLVVEPELMEEKDFYLIDHRIGADVDDSQLYCLPPSTRSGAANHAGPDPTWKESYTVYAAHASIRRIADLHALDNLQTPPEQVELEGQPLLLLATLHDDSPSPNGPAFCGRFLVPQVNKGQPVDQWFKLHDRDGTPVVGAANGQPSTVRLRFAYGAIRPSPPPSVTNGSEATASDTGNLPPGWERKMDPSGRMFYVNHTHRTFSWTPPPPAAAGGQSTPGSPQPPYPPQPAQPAPLEHHSPSLPATVEARAPSPHHSPPPRRSPSPSTIEAPHPPSHHEAPRSPHTHAHAHSSPHNTHGDGVLHRPESSPQRSPPPEQPPRPPPKNSGYAIPGPMYPPKPSMHQAKVYVTVVEGAGMPQTDPNGACDAFCEVFLEASKYELAYGRTSACPNTARPVWNEQLMYGVDADQVSLVDLKVVLMDWNADGKNRFLGQLRKVPLTELMHNRRMDVWLRTMATDDSGKPLDHPGHDLDLDKCIVHLVLEYESPQVDASVGNVLLDPAQPPAVTPMKDSGAAFISAERSMQLTDAHRPPGQSTGGGGDAGVGMVLKVGDQGQFVVELLAEGSPAALSGKIAPGDILLDVDGQPLGPLSLPEVQALLRGEPHSPVTLTLLHYIPGAHSYGPQQVVTTVLRSKLNRPAAQPTRAASSGLGPGTGIMLLPTGEALPPLGSSSYSRLETGLSQSLSSMPHQPAMSPPHPERISLSVSQQERTLEPALIDSDLQRRVDEARRHTEALARQERELLTASSSAMYLKNANADPFGHLKAEFGKLMGDIYADRPDPDMEKAYAWKNRLLYGTAETLMAAPTSHQHGRVAGSVTALT